MPLLASSCLPQQTLNFPSDLLTRCFETDKNSLHLPKPIRNTGGIVNKFMTVATGEINLQSKQDQCQCIPWLMLYHLDQTNVVNKEFIIRVLRKCFLRDAAESPKLHLARSVANHSAGFDSSCRLAELAIS